MRAARSHRVRGGVENEGTVMHGVHFFYGERVFLGKCACAREKKITTVNPLVSKAWTKGRGVKGYTTHGRWPVKKGL